jgi:hypothetical protein
LNTIFASTFEWLTVLIVHLFPQSMWLLEKITLFFFQNMYLFYKLPNQSSIFSLYFENNFCSLRIRYTFLILWKYKSYYDLQKKKNWIKAKYLYFRFDEVFFAKFFFCGNFQTKDLTIMTSTNTVSNSILNIEIFKLN